MATIDANIHLADYYFSILDSLSKKAKLYLVKRLTESLLGANEFAQTDTEAEKDKSFHNLAGIWANDPEAEHIEEAIKDSRISNRTRQLIPLDE
ncbi:MAG TPA: hypothetical protein H9824_04320 [Candidatus Bacteroides pullicola]|uniref:Uncharacterized protein n=1 Tax=Candidatus Bacteroides pullicola TaxID=2838475 RepID=A0A9D1ZKS1_9BACE|nr:hypothetical protein [Candidatus Bacteroides pullicola]